ncbi:BNI4 [Candida jiufengensis]|uniref:BNI4 n=1 Tax=Candida jiufengensis TaxID=497108 RepID=UPI00222586BF|nr:BNI4 [Candida jiufengensis]KAI5953655.1 BNI4 [Candida jiufengensis]
MSSNTTEFNDFFAENNFYSAPNTQHSSNHINTLKNAIPNSISSKSIKDGLNDNENNGKSKSNSTSRTSIIKSSPSLKALESILNEKNKKWAPNSIKEEDEEEETDDFDTELHKKYDYTNPSPVKYKQSNNTTDTLTTFQSFETANESIDQSKSQNQWSSQKQFRTNSNSHKHNKSLTSSISISGSGYSTDDTPILEQPPTFQNYTPHNNESPQLKVIETGKVSSKDNTLINDSTSTESKDNNIDDSEETIQLVDDLKAKNSITNLSNNFVSELKFKNEKNNKINIYESSTKNNKLITTNNKINNNNKNFKERDNFKFSSDTPRPFSQNVSAPLDKNLPSLPNKSNTIGMNKLKENGFKSKSMLSTLPITKDDLIPQQQVEQQKSPHTRSNSSFSLNMMKQEKPKLQRKRSSTMDDLKKVGQRDENIQPEKKKFSFRSLFKSKSKNHSLNKSSDELSSTKPPVQVTSKSYSTTTIPTYQETLPPLTKTKSNTSIINVFKRNKSVEQLKSEELKSELPKKSTQQSSSPVNQQIKKVEPDLQTIPDTDSPILLDANNSKAKPGSVNFIREVSDNNIGFKFKEPSSTESESENFQDAEEEDDDKLSFVKSNDEHDYDSNNILENPPTRKINNQFGEEISLMPSFLENSQFGSPFKVNYQSSPHGSPTTNHYKPVKFPSPSPLPNRNPKDDKNQQLLGEALFPRSLNAHEVESIVSLERSRSLKSIKSNKRNSFVNYNGSDDNIIHYNGPALSPNTSGITRSNSILKNSGSKKSNLNKEAVDNTNGLPSPAQPNESIDGNLLDSIDFMEFSDFIDVDNLNFNYSPNGAQSGTASPKIEPSSNGKLNDIIATTAKETQEEDLQFQSPPPPPQQQQQQQLPQSKENELVSSPPTIVVNESSSASPNDLKLDTISFPNSANSHTSPVPIIIESRTPSPSPLSMEREESPKTSLEVDGFDKNFEQKESILSDRIDNKDSDEEDEMKALKNSPILQTAIKGNTSIKDLNDDGKSNFNNRPISMSFKGLDAPSFSGKFTQHNLRSSDSHQSFTISFNDSSSSVGGGFGTTEDEDEDDEEEEEEEADNEAGVSSDYYDDEEALLNEYEKENLVPYTKKSPQSSHQPKFQSSQQKWTPPQRSTSTFGKENNNSNNFDFSPIQPPPPFNTKFSHNKIPSISDQSSTNSSPRSFTSMLGKWKKGYTTTNNNIIRPAPPPPSSFSPLKQSGVRFSSRIILYDTYNGDEYDRHPDTATCNQLTPSLAQQIKEEMNLIKSEMEVHVESRCYTQFF